MPARRAWTTLGSAELRKEAIPLPTGDHVIYAVDVLRLAQAQVEERTDGCFLGSSGRQENR